jgi:hypothetical protein
LKTRPHKSEYKTSKSKKKKKREFVRNKVSGGPFSRQGIFAYKLADVGGGATNMGT